jgi:hypothetical protein
MRNLRLHATAVLLVDELALYGMSAQAARDERPETSISRRYGRCG